MPHSMRRPLHRLVALCLALLWGPATMCCALEAAGFEALCSDAACHSEDGASTPLNGCGVVESGKYQSVAPTIKTSPATVLVCACLACVHDLVTAPGLAARPLINASDHPLDWLVSWQFVRRAAAPAHAPDSLIA